MFVDSAKSAPLPLRLERERLLDVFFKEIMQNKNVEIDVLCHGVTRERFKRQVQRRGGYHIVHWSGHGLHDLLEIERDEQEIRTQQAGAISGEDLVRLIQEAGVFAPSLFFLSACFSGSIVDAKDWATLSAQLHDTVGRRGEKDGRPLDQVIGDSEGYAGTALSLLRADVPQVVAMRWEVGERYARTLAEHFYRFLLADDASRPVDEALFLARRQVEALERVGEFEALDHATPIVFGASRVVFQPEASPSEQLERKDPRPSPILPGSGDLDLPKGFVGRTEELGRLFRQWLDAGDKPIALLQGLAGIGKTTLAAEVIHLAHERFDHVFAFQSRRDEFFLEEFYQRLDHRLGMASPRYVERCEKNRYEAIYVAADKRLSGKARYEKLQQNVINAMKWERILLVLDNFEPNLRTVETKDGYACKDEKWDALFGALADGLAGSNSRVLVTSRHRLVSLSRREVHWVPVGPLRPGEAMLFFEGREHLRRLWDSKNADENGLAQRILDVSRGHPLILQRLDDLVRPVAEKSGDSSSAIRVLLKEVLDRLTKEGFRVLPDVFEGVQGDAQREEERRYLEDVAIGAVDLLLQRVQPEARLLLWVLTRMGEAVVEGVLERGWEKLKGKNEPIGDWLDSLVNSGLVAREGDACTFHELVTWRSFGMRSMLRVSARRSRRWPMYGMN